MLSNLHTHTTFCDGKSTVEEIVQTAIQKGFDSIGFSGHGFTDFDSSYCMKDTDGYIDAVNAAKRKFDGKIEVYLGVEEDAFYPLPNRNVFDYRIGSSHYFRINGSEYPIDSNVACFNKCMEMANGDYLLLAEGYYRCFCEYLTTYKPDIIGHFDLVTKFDELENSPHILQDPAYQAIAQQYVKEAIKSGGLFEVNTGAISRGYRTAPYPSADLLYTIKANGGELILSADSHHKDTIDFGFDDARALLRDIGFDHVYALVNGSFTKDYL